jgi:hypothetical protein
MRPLFLLALPFLGACNSECGDPTRVNGAWAVFHQVTNLGEGGDASVDAGDGSGPPLASRVVQRPRPSAAGCPAAPSSRAKGAAPVQQAGSLVQVRGQHEESAQSAALMVMGMDLTPSVVPPAARPAPADDAPAARLHEHHGS